MPKREKYHLQRLLEARERTRDEAVKFLAECRRQLALEETELERREQAVRDCRQAQSKTQTEMLEKGRGGIKNAEIMLYQRHLFDLRERETELLAAVEEQKLTIERAAAEVENALVALGEASREMRVIEKHRENWQRERRVEAARGEQKINDEIGATLHERRESE